MYKTKIGLVQINNSFSNQNYFPYSVGILQAYAQKYLSRKELFDFMLPIYKRIPVAEASEKLSTADIIFFSAYTWNINISLEIAKQIKKNKPQVITVFGGPEIPVNDIQNFLATKGSYLATYSCPDANGIIRRAAEIIYNAAVAHKINPKYLLVKLQKELMVFEKWVRQLLTVAT